MKNIETTSLFAASALFESALREQARCGAKWSTSTEAHTALSAIEQITGIEYPILIVALNEALAVSLLHQFKDCSRFLGCHAEDEETRVEHTIHTLVDKYLSRRFMGTKQAPGFHSWARQRLESGSFTLAGYTPQFVATFHRILDERDPPAEVITLVPVNGGGA